MQNELETIRRSRSRHNLEATAHDAYPVARGSSGLSFRCIGRVLAFLFKLYALSFIHFLIWPVNYVKLYNLVDAPAESLSPLARFLLPDCPQSIRLPARVERLLIYSMLGSVVLLWATGDEYLYGGQASTAVFSDPPRLAVPVHRGRSYHPHPGSFFVAC
jgi:hypothetical protein